MSKSTGPEVRQNAIKEYMAGIYASGLIGRTLIPLIALTFLAAFLTGMVDVVSRWKLSIPLWAHIVSTATFAVGVFEIARGHVRHTREAGRRFLSQGSKA